MPPHSLTCTKLTAMPLCCPGPNPNCYTECICAASKHANEGAGAEWVSTFKASDLRSFTTQVVACATWAAESMVTTLPQHVQDHLKQTMCEPGDCPQ